MVWGKHYLHPAAKGFPRTPERKAVMPAGLLLHTKPTEESLQSMFPEAHEREKDLFFRIMVEKEIPISLFSDLG